MTCDSLFDGLLAKSTLGSSVTFLFLVKVSLNKNISNVSKRFYIISVNAEKWLKSEVHSEPCQSKMHSFAKIVNGWKLLTISIKRSILDVWQGSESPSGTSCYSYILKMGYFLINKWFIYSEQLFLEDLRLMFSTSKSVLLDWCFFSKHLSGFSFLLGNCCMFLFYIFWNLQVCFDILYKDFLWILESCNMRIFPIFNVVRVMVIRH